jgi:hypothetical protein
MSKLSAKARSKIPAKDFAGPGRSFPIENKSHAKAAISGATRSERAGNISLEEAVKIKAAARAKLAGK